MTSPGGIGVGAVLLGSIVAAGSNLRRDDPRLVSTAPDLLTLVVVVAVVWSAVGWVRPRNKLPGNIRATQKSHGLAS